MNRFLLVFVILIAPLLGGEKLQKVIDNAKPDSKIELPKGVFKGNIVINKPLILVGKGKYSVIRGDGNGSVIKIRSSNVAVKNLVI